MTDQEIARIYRSFPVEKRDMLLEEFRKEIQTLVDPHQMTYDLAEIREIVRIRRQLKI